LKKPNVSVIIATHSRPHLLPRAVESAQRAGSDVEVVVVDDASTDATAEVCQKLQGIRYVRVDRNQRVAGARNLGILASTADHLTFLDDDDYRLPDSLDRQIAVLDAAPEAGMVYGQAILANQDGSLSEQIEPAVCRQGDIFWPLLEHNFIHCLTTVFRRSCLYRAGLLDQSLPGMDDWDLWVRIAELYPVVAVAEPVGVWRSFMPDSDQGSARMSELFRLCAAVHESKWMKLPRAVAAPESARRRSRRGQLDRFSDVLIWHAATILPQGYRRHARKHLLTAISLNPKRALRPWTLRLLASTFGPGGRQDRKHRNISETGPEVVNR
jgi:glycosyltransferase involved in cell wall biosynthesis